MVTAGRSTSQLSRRFTHAHDLRGGTRGDRAFQRCGLPGVLARAHLIGRESQVSVKREFRIAQRPNFLPQSEFGHGVGNIAQPAFPMQRRRLIDVVGDRIDEAVVFVRRVFAPCRFGDLADLRRISF